MHNKMVMLLIVASSQMLEAPVFMKAYQEGYRFAKKTKSWDIGREAL